MLDRPVFHSSSRRPVALVGLIALLAGVAATPEPSPPAITNATVAARVVAARTKADQLALADYYFAQARAEEPRIAYYDQLFRAYMRLEGKEAEPLQRRARALLKAARMSKQQAELLGSAHRNLAWDE